MTTTPARPASSFRKVRADHALETAEDYVEAVAAILDRRGQCRVRDLALHMGVSHVTVSRIISRLQEANLVDTRPHKPIELTARGRRLAALSRRRHDIVLSFLLAIGVPQSEADRDAEGIEHHVGRATLKAMSRFLEKPQS